MHKIISRWFMFSLLLGWALTHATVFAQPAKTGTPADKLRAALDKNVTLDFTGGSLTDVLNHFRDKTGIAMNIDQMALMQAGIDVGGGGAFPPGAGGGPMQQIQVKATNEKASQVLRKLLNAHQLSYVILDDAVLVTTEDAGLMRQMRQRVSVDVEDVPFNKAVRTLAKNHGINLVIDPAVVAKSEAKVSLQLESTGFETAMRLLAELANLKAVRMGNVMFVTTEEKADKIRKEEKNQFDNPFNPNLPMPMFRGGGFGGIGTAMPLPGKALPPVQAIPGGAAPPIDVIPNKAIPDLPPPKGGATPSPARPRPAGAPAVEAPPLPPAPARPRE